MISFQKLWEKLEEFDDDVPNEDKAISVIRTGLGVDSNFWNNFLQVINNADGLSELLDCPVEKIVRWRSKIQEYLDKVEDQDKPKIHKKNKIIKTGHQEIE